MHAVAIKENEYYRNITICLYFVINDPFVFCTERYGNVGAFTTLLYITAIAFSNNNRIPLSREEGNVKMPCLLTMDVSSVAFSV